MDRYCKFNNGHKNVMTTDISISRPLDRAGRQTDGNTVLEEE